MVVQASISGVSVKGLKGCKTLNKDPDSKNPLEGKEERSVLHFDQSFVIFVYILFFYTTVTFETPMVPHFSNNIFLSLNCSLHWWKIRAIF